MRVAKLAIENHQFTIVLFIALLVGGLSAFFEMPRKEDPVIYVPGAVIYVSFPGANPTDLESLVMEPIERAVNELEEIRFIRSQAVEGFCYVNVEFEYGLDPEEKYAEVVEKVNSIRSALPEGISLLRFRKKSNINTVMMQVALVSQSEQPDYAQIEQSAKALQKRLDQLNGIKLTEIRALPGFEVRISPDLAKMSQMGIGFDQIKQAIQGDNLNIPAGAVRLGSRQFNLNTSGAYKDLDQIRNSVIGGYQGKSIQLQHIARVEMVQEDDRYLARVNGNPAVYITIVQKVKANIFEVSKNIEEELAAFSAELPSDLRLEVVFKQAEMVQDRINGFLVNLLQGVGLVGFVILMALGFRSSLIVMIAIPFSIMIGLASVHLGGIGLEQMSIAALVVALGLLVDNSIAITENIERFLHLGERPIQAAIKGTAQLGWPITSATATTLLAFFPLVMMPEKAGDFLKSMPLTVMATLSASLLIALVLTPLIASRFLKSSTERPKYIPPLERMSRWFVSGPYNQALSWVIRHPKWTISISLLIFALSLSIIPFVGVSLFPNAERPQLLIRIEAGPGAHFDQTDSITRKVEALLDASPEIRSYASNIGKGNARVYYNTYENGYELNYADILIQLYQYEKQAFNRLVLRLQEGLAEIPEASFKLVVFEQGIVSEHDLEVRILGENLEQIQVLSEAVSRLLEGIQGLEEVENIVSQNLTNLQLDINRKKAGLLGLPLARIDQSVRTAIRGQNIGEFRDKNGKSFPIMLRAESQFSPTDLQKIPIQSVHGTFVPLDQVANIRFAPAPSMISHYDLQRYGVVYANIGPNAQVADRTAEVDRQLSLLDWPTGYDYKLAGEQELRDETFGGMGDAAILATILIYAVLILQFRSFLQPMIIFSAIPMAAIGSIWALYLAGFTFSLTAVVGLISLIGIVINDSIVLVDFANKEIQQGKERAIALKEAGKVRFLPILLTSLTTIGGLIPLTISGGAMWAPMGLAMIGGLLASTILILLVVPALFMLLTTRKNEPNNEIPPNS